MELVKKVSDVRSKCHCRVRPAPGILVMPAKCTELQSSTFYSAVAAGIIPVGGGWTAMWKRAVPGWLADASIRGATATTDIPSPRTLPIIGTTADLIAAGGAPKLHEYVDARHRQLGPIYRENIGPVKSVLVADPNDMRRVFSLEGKYPKHLLPAPWVVYNKIYGCKRGLFFM